MVAIDTCQAGVKQGMTYMVLIMATTQTKEMYSELLKPNKLIYQSVARSYSNNYHMFSLRS